MMKKISTWGVAAVVVYVLFTTFLFVYSINCTETFCGLVALIAGMPWLWLLDTLGGDSYNSGVFGWASIILNILVLYFIFAALQQWKRKK